MNLQQTHPHPQFETVFSLVEVIRWAYGALRGNIQTLLWERERKLATEYMKILWNGEEEKMHL